MPISYTANQIKLRAIIERKRRARLTLPEHQRDFCWSLRQQKTLISSIQRNKPIPSVLIREKEDGLHSLEDGHQRLESVSRYMDDMFPDETGRKYSELTPLEKQRFDDYDIIATTYTGASDEEAREIFNDTQNGRPLTFGERIGSLSTTAPIVRYAIRMLLTPGEGFYEEIKPFWGEHSQKARRGCDMTIAFAICAGLAFGIKNLSKKWDDAAAVLHRDFDEVATTRRLRLLISIFARMHETAPVNTKPLRNAYWDVGNFTGYIIWSILFQESPLLDETSPYTILDTTTLVGTWVDYLVAQRNQTGLLSEVLHRDISAARSWNQVRWANGVRRLFAPQTFVVVGAGEIEDDDDDA